MTIDIKEIKIFLDFNPPSVVCAVSQLGLMDSSDQGGFTLSDESKDLIVELKLCLLRDFQSSYVSKMTSVASKP